MIHAFIFDVDGTLVDTNPLHARAWADTFARFGLRVGEDQVKPHIGKGGDKLVPSLVDVDDETSQRLRSAHNEAFARLASEEGIPVFPGGRELLADLRGRGVATAIATSAKRTDFDVVEARSGWELSDDVDRLVTSDDADRSKPDPDIVAAAIAALGVAKSTCVMVGDTPYDGAAARRAGARFIGVTTGYHDERALRAAGAERVFPDVGALHAKVALLLGG